MIFSRQQSSDSPALTPFLWLRKVAGVLLVTGELLSELAQQPRVLRVLVQVSKVALLVLVTVLTVRVQQQPAGEALLHHWVVNHQPGQRAEHLAEPLDPEPGLRHHDQVVEDAGRVVRPGHPDTDGQTAGALAAGVPHHEASLRTVGQEFDCQVPGQVRLVPAGLLRQVVHEGEVHHSRPRLGAVGAGAAGGRLLKAGQLCRQLRLLAGVAGVVVVVVADHCPRVGKIVDNFLERSLLVVGLELVLAHLIV